jgi:DNA polymerase-3 subunit delta'
MAHRLATNADARERRAKTLEVALGIRSISGAMMAATSLLAVAGDDAKAITEEKDAEERASALRSLGVEPGGTIPPALRAQLKNLEEDQKRRATRSLRDGIDRILVDLLSLYRDILLLQLGVPSDPINLAIYAELLRASEKSAPEVTLATIDAIGIARRRIESNVTPALALEAMLVTAIRREPSR